MSKKRSKKLIISFLIIILLIAGVIGYSQITGTGITGSSLLSLQQVDLRSTSSYLDGKQWVYTLRAGGLSQYAQARIEPQQAGQFWSGNEEPENSFSIDTNFEQECVFPIVRDNTKQRVLRIQEESNSIAWLKTHFLVWSLTEDILKERCQELGHDGFIAGASSGLYQYMFCYNIEANTVGSEQRFTQAQINNIIDIDVNGVGGGSVQFQTLTREGEGLSEQGKVGNNVYAIFQGSLSTGKVCGTEGAGDIIPIYWNGRWKLVPKSYYDNYISSINILQTSIADLDTLRRVSDNLNYYVDRIDSSSVSFGTIAEPSRESGTSIKKQVSSFVENPVLTMYIKASWLGIVSPVPDLSIINHESLCIGNAEDGTIKVRVKNSGSERGSATISGFCNDLSFSIISESFSINDGETKDVYVKWRGSPKEGEGETKTSCNMKIEYVGDVKEFTHNLCVKNDVVCTQVGKTFCDGNKIVKCVNEFKKEEIKTCDGECIVEEGKVKCSEDNGGFVIGDCDKLFSKTTDPTCWGTKSQIILGVFAFIIGLIIFLISFSLLRNKFLPKKKDRPIAIIISILLGIGLAILTWFFFIISLIIFIVYIIISIIIKGFL